MGPGKGDRDLFLLCFWSLAAFCRIPYTLRDGCLGPSFVLGRLPPADWWSRSNKTKHQGLWATECSSRNRTGISRVTYVTQRAEL